MQPEKLMRFTQLSNMARRSVSSSAVTMVREAPVNEQLDRSPMVELVNYIVATALDERASDIHIEPLNGKPRIRYRIDGRMETAFEALPSELYGNLISRIKIICRLNIAETRLPQDGRFSYRYETSEIDVRVSIVPLIYGEKVVMRLLNNKACFKDMDGLQLSADNKRLLLQLCQQSGGALLMAGPVNSGKTTTLYAALNYLNNGSRNIITVEDPVEYHMEGINQIQVNHKLKLDFEEALQAVLRQDYDALAVGEIRSSAVADMLIKASLAGHLVLSTIHTADAAQAIYRLLDMGVKPYMISAAIKGIVAQRLVPGLCPKCRQSYEVVPDSAEARFLDKKYIPGMKLYRSGGCPSCAGNGVMGRLAIHEVLIMDDRLRECISSRPTLQQLRQTIASSNIVSIKEDGISKALEGKCTLTEIINVCTD